jgi:hypothetical protein
VRDIYKKHARHGVILASVTLDDFYAYMPMHNYIFVPTRATCPVESVNSRIGLVALTDRDGRPITREGRVVKVKANVWLDRYRSVEQMIWAPALPMIVRGRLLVDGGWIEHAGVACFNLYRPPSWTCPALVERDWLIRRPCFRTEPGL